MVADQKHRNDYKRNWAKNHKNSRQETNQKCYLKRLNSGKKLHPDVSKQAVRDQGRKFELCSECELCPEDDKATENLQRHHPDYDFPHIFLTVCGSCHRYVEMGIF